MLNKVISIVVISVMPLLSMAQKAYEMVKYSGKVQGKTVSFKLANGYIAASELTLTPAAAKTSISFKPDSGTPDEQQYLTFKSTKAANGFFLLKNMQEVYDEPPAVIIGVYNLGAQTLSVKLVLDKVKI